MNRYSAADADAITERKRLLGQWIRERRSELGLTQANVAELAGNNVSTETVRTYESGRSADRPTTRVLESIDQALGWCLGSSKMVLDKGAEPVLDNGTAAPPAPQQQQRTVSTGLPNGSGVTVDRQQLRQLVALTSELLSSAAQADDIKEVLDDITAVNRLATDMALAAL